MKVNSRIAHLRGERAALSIITAVLIGLLTIQHMVILSILDAPHPTQEEMKYAYDHGYKMQVSCDSYSIRYSK